MAPQKKNEPGQAKVSRARRSPAGLAWRMPPLPWILNAAQPAQPTPRRVLVGGAIQEALLLAKSLPETKVVAIDPSEKLARALRLSSKRRRLSNLESFHASWDQPDLLEIVGGHFDLALLPGLPVPPSRLAAALKNLAQCMQHPHGTIYLRVPGESHPYMRPADILEALGESPRQLDDASRPSSALRLAATMAGDSMPDQMPFPPVRFSLEDWLGALESAGLRFVAALHVPGVLARALSVGGIDHLMPRGARNLALLLDQIDAPAERHLVLAISENPEPPWSDPEQLAAWCPAVHFWPRHRIPAQSEPFNRLFSVDLEMQRILPKLTLQLSGYMLELLRTADGSTALRDLIARIPHPATIQELLSALWFFHHACILRLLPNRG